MFSFEHYNINVLVLQPNSIKKGDFNCNFVRIEENKEFFL